jgi:hypothetical protein
MRAIAAKRPPTRLGLFERRRVVVRMDIGRLADHSVQRPEPTHVLWLATFFVDAAHRLVTAVDGKVLTILADG